MTTDSLHVLHRSRRRSAPHAKTSGDKTQVLDVAAAERQDAQRLVCRHLVIGCERALAELRVELENASTPADVRVGLEAAELLESILDDWRMASQVIDEQDEEPTPPGGE
jgi:hypothetical protein